MFGVALNSSLVHCPSANQGMLLETVSIGVSVCEGCGTHTHSWRGPLGLSSSMITFLVVESVVLSSSGQWL